MATVAKANNVQLSNISVTNNVTNTGKIIHFDISWENSWRTASTNNYDGVWVFFKFKDNDGKWYHLRFTTGNVTMPAGAEHDFGGNPGLPGIGMYIFRNSNGAGSVNFTNISAGIQSFPGTFEIRGFAIEMVYVPQGSFYVGDGNMVGNFYRDFVNQTPYLVNSDTITMGSQAGQLYDTLRTNQNTITLTGFPTGYSSFWMMKYEVSQGAYRDFLNTLTYNQQVSRMEVLPNSASGTHIMAATISTRYQLEIITPGSNPNGATIGCDNTNDNIYNQSNDGEWRAMGFLKWPDVAAYLDWAGLRPMTELEYEKAARGGLAPVLNEYAWGTPDIYSINVGGIAFVNNGQSSETLNMSSSVAGNALQGIDPMLFSYISHGRGGMFASSISTRVSAGAGYYGAMELTGNMLEFTVNTATVAGRSYKGKLGDGALDVAGNANENHWPGINGNNDLTVANAVYGGITGVTAAAGMQTRGGYFYSPPLTIMTSHRHNVSSSGSFETRNVFYGIRGVRDAN